MRDIVFFTLFRNDNAYSSISLSMAKEAAKTVRVLYVNHPYTLKDVITGLRAGDPVLRRRLPAMLAGRVGFEADERIPERFTVVQPPLVLPVNWLPSGKIYRFFQRFNERIVLRALRKGVVKYGLKDFLYINCYNPFYLGVLPQTEGAILSIYHCIDDITQNPYTDKHGTRLENEAVEKADYTFVTSTNLRKLKSPFSNRIVDYYNAADIEIFGRALTEKFPRPGLLNDRRGKVIGFIGNLDELRIDYPLLKKTAEAFPEHTLLLVGPVNSPEPRQIGLDTLPNVVFAGSRKLEELPAWLQHMDCVLIPFLCNTLTASIYPLKINEYLSAAKPVISTAFSEDIRTFASCIYLADNADRFTELIEAALNERDPELQTRRLHIARQNTWEARLKQLWRLIETTPTPLT